MTRAHRLLPILLLLSCASPAMNGAQSSVGWLHVAQSRISASARAIVPQGDGFAAALPGHAAFAHFTAEGLTLGELHAEQPLRLRFVAWGSQGSEQEVEAVEPTLGDCLNDLLPEGGCIRRLEYDHEGVTAWWVGLQRGVEFGWTVAAPPEDGDDALVFAMEVDGATVMQAVGDGAELVDADGETWAVSGALAWGADGASLPARLLVEEDGLRVWVHTRGARFPVTVDPVLETPTTTMEGDGDVQGFGLTVSDAGDVNGDGYDDIIIGAPYVDLGAANCVGAAFVHHGSASGVSSLASLSLIGDRYQELFAYSVSAAGDVNGDGFGDVLIGAPFYDSDELGQNGEVYVHYGSSTGLSPTAGLRLVGSEVNSNLGYAVSAAGDVNGDEYDDVIIGVLLATDSIGGAHVHHGSMSGLEESPRSTVMGSAAGDDFGTAVSGAGDVNGDGYDDIIVGAARYSSETLASAGAVSVYHGSPTGVSTEASLRLTGAAAIEKLGYAVSSAGDVNGDGYDDVIVSAPAAETGMPDTHGVVYVHHGGPGGLSSTANLRLTGVESTLIFGHSISGAGDVNGDHYDDIVIAAAYDDEHLRAGTVYVHHGSPSGVEPIASFTQSGAGPSDYFGRGLSTAGDVNADGYDDIIIGAYGVSTGDYRVNGAAYVYHGYQDRDLDGAYLGGDAATPQDCDDDDASVGAPSTQYTDADGDGFGEAAWGTACPGEPGTAPNATDCDGGRADIHPDATDIPDDGVDQDCDGEDATRRESGDDAEGSDATEAIDGVSSSTEGGEAASDKSGCAVAAAAPHTLLAALLTAPALLRRRSAQRPRPGSRNPDHRSGPRHPASSAPQAPMTATPASSKGSPPAG